MDDSFDLQRFVDAQAPAMERVRDELRAGRKTSHWMWFVFPQIAGLGSGAMAQRYAIGSLAEARAYLAHPILGPRLRECVDLVLAVEGWTAHAIFGSPDDLKFRSCLSLSAQVSNEPRFNAALNQYFDAAPDPATLRIVGVAAD